MRDINDQIRDYIDKVSPSITLDEVTVPVGLGVDGEATLTGHRRRWRAMVALAACLALVGGVVMVARAQRSDDQVAAGPGTAAGAAEDSRWLTVFGPEKASPPVPQGWKVLDFADMRFAVPSAWATPLSRSCSTATVGVVLVSNGSPETACSPVKPLPPSTLVIEPAAAATTTAGRGAQVMVGTFSAEALGGPSCLECPMRYRLDNGYEVTVGGPDADRVLSTFTDSGPRRALQSGRESDTSDWRDATFDNVSFKVPPAWRSLDLPGNYTQATAADGAIGQKGVVADPGICGNSMFTEQATVYLGSSPIRPPCPPGMEESLEPRDGAWIRALTDDAKPSRARPITQGRLNGLDITIVDTNRTSEPAPSPVLDVEVRDGAKTLWITLGVGIDPSIARSVLRSIRPVGSGPANRSTATTSDSAAPQDHPTGQTTSTTSARALKATVPWTAPNDRTNPGCPDELRSWDPAPYVTIAASLPEPIRSTYKQTLQRIANCTFVEYQTHSTRPPVNGTALAENGPNVPFNRAALQALKAPPTVAANGNYSWGQPTLPFCSVYISIGSGAEASSASFNLSGCPGVPPTSTP